MKVKGLVLALSMAFGLSANAALLNSKGDSPFEILQKASVEKKAEFIATLKQQTNFNSLNERQKTAFESLVSENPEVTGDEVFEALGPKFTNWFYGIKTEENMTLKDLTHNVGRISRTPDVATCMNHSVCVIVDISSQKMRAYQGGQPIPGVDGLSVSTAGPGYSTVTGIFSVDENLHNKNSSSRKYGGWMGWRMQIHGGYFLHATAALKRLGRPASHGCVRMWPKAAEKLSSIMLRTSKSNIRVVIKQ